MHSSIRYTVLQLERRSWDVHGWAETVSTGLPPGPHSHAKRLQLPRAGAAETQMDVRAYNALQVDRILVARSDKCVLRHLSCD